MALFSAGCLSLGNKNKEAAVDAPPPPPAAYPDTSGAMIAGSSSGAPSEVPSVPSSATMAATNRAPSAPAAPVPFSLREGEQLVAHQIQSGENLSSIATKYNTSIGRIQSANGMTDTRIYAGKTLQVPTSAAPMGVGQAAPSASPVSPSAIAPAYSSAPAAGAYPSITAPPTAPAYPGVSAAPDAITAPPIPASPAAVAPQGYPDPASTSYPRTSPTPTTAGSFPTPSFEASRIQFSN